MDSLAFIDAESKDSAIETLPNETSQNFELNTASSISEDKLVDLQLNGSITEITLREDDSKVHRATDTQYFYEPPKKNNYHILFGEKFDLSIEDGKVILTHPTWSLTGIGENLLKAEYDLIGDAKIIAEEYLFTRDTDLTEEARNLKSFLFNIY